MKRIPLIIDCDPGHDDAIALLLALASDEIDLKAITATAGNQEVSKTTNNVLKILELCKRNEVLVASGRTNPLFHEVKVAPDVHGDSGMDGPVLPKPTKKADSRPSVEVIADMVKNSPDKVTIAILGPLTNIAVFVLSYPELLSNVECFTIMGGSMYEGNRTSVAEFNVWQDPEAAEIVFSSGVPLKIFGLDVTHKNLILTEDYHLFKEKQGPIYKFVADLLDFYSKNYVAVRHFPGCPIHDACTIAEMRHPEIYSGFRSSIHCDLQGEITRGSLVVDSRPEYRRTKPANGTYFTDVDRQAFLQLVLDSCEKIQEKMED